jgi:hypothetical protein
MKKLASTVAIVKPPLARRLLRFATALRVTIATAPATGSYGRKGDLSTL